LPVAEGPEFVRLFADFTTALRAAGLTVGTGDTMTLCAAAGYLDPSDLLDLYWSGRTTLVKRRDDLGTYDRVFREFFLGERADLPEPLKLRKQRDAQGDAAIAIPQTEPGPDVGDEDATLGLTAASVAVLRDKSFAACTPDELAALRRIMARIRLAPPRRRSRRTVRGRTGRTPDLRRTIRTAMRVQGDPARLHWRRRKQRPRPLVLVLDVSGSMADHSRALLQFAYSARRAAGRVEVFCFGTRLTRITPELTRRRPDDALERAARAVRDWDGGTRIGDSLQTLVRAWARRGTCRGAIVVICSDGLDCGDPAILNAALTRLKLLCHSLVWLNPLLGTNPDLRGAPVAMMVAAPHIDLMLSGHDLRSMEDFARLLPQLG
jgi:uncharacterized protein with von Willebrand factor type A (vWA) domain